MLTHAVDYGSGVPVDYAPDGAVDYTCWRMLWISQPFGLGRICRTVSTLVI